MEIIKRKFFPALLTLVFIVSVSINCFGAEHRDSNFQDVVPDAWFFNDVKYAEINNWISGSDDGKFHPDANITLIQSTAIVLNSAGLYHLRTDSEPWYQNYYDYCLKKGFISKEEDLNSEITRFRLAKLIYDIYRINKIEKENIEPIYDDTTNYYVEELAAMGAFKNITDFNEDNFEGNKYVTKAQTCSILRRLENSMKLSEYIFSNDNFINPKDYLNNEMFLISKDYFEFKEINRVNVSNFIINMSVQNKFKDSFYITSEKTVDELYNAFSEMKNTIDMAYGQYPDYVGITPQYSYSISEIESHRYKVNISLHPNDLWTKSKALAERDMMFDNCDSLITYLYGKRVLTKSMTEYQKAEAIALYIVNTTRYDLSIETDSHYGAKFFTDNTVVCDGYSSLFCAFMRILGIESYGVTGKYNDTDHMWNIVKLDGQWLMVDLTFMDFVSYNSFGVRENNVDESYFGLTTKELLEKDSDKNRIISDLCYEYLDNLNINY